MIAFIGNELRPVFGDLGSFTAFGKQGVSTYTMPFESSRIEVRPSEYPARLGFFVMYVIYDALVERLYTRYATDVTLMETLMFSDEVNAWRWPAQRFSVNYRRAHDIDVKQQGTVQERYCQGLDLCSAVINARMTPSTVTQFTQLVRIWWKRV